MADKRVFACAATLCAINIICLLKKKKKKQRIWVKPWVSRRDVQGIHSNLLKEFLNEDIKYYKKYLRMDENSFNFIVSKISPFIKRQNTHLRNAISVEERLMLTLRFLATGESFSSLQFSTRISQPTISCIIPETCNAIYNAMKDEFLKVPSTELEWGNIANEFQEKWNCFNTIGAMDGKHIRIKCPPSGGSHYFNYKNYNSIILFALCDANYKFTYVDVGTNGRIGDSGVYAKSTLRRCLIDRSILNIPKEHNLGMTNILTPYVVLADNAFPLTYNVMKPYPLRNISKEEKIFNYRLSRGRRMIESSFGILASRFRVFLTTINLVPEKVTSIALACCTLHNFLTEKRKYMYSQKQIYTLTTNDCEFLEMRSLEETADMEVLRSQRTLGNSRPGKDVREEFKMFYNRMGSVPWQENYIN